MKKEKYQEAEIEIIKLEQEDIVRSSNTSSDDDGPIELPFIPIK